MIAGTLQCLHHHVTRSHATALRLWLTYVASEPMVCSDRPAIVFAPHQDDETFGCGGLIALKKANRIPVTIVFLTDGRGAARLPGVTEEALVKTRRHEAIAASASLGVPEMDLHFLDLPDTQLSHLSQDEQHRVTKEIDAMLDRNPDVEIYVTHRHDSHPDHEAAWSLVNKVAASRYPKIPVFEYSIWMTWLAKLLRSLRREDIRGACRLDIAAVRQQKRAAILAYRSQVRALPTGFISRFEAPHELFFRP